MRSPLLHTNVPWPKRTDAVVRSATREQGLSFSESPAATTP